MKGSFYFAVFFLLLGLFGIIQSLTFEYWESILLPLAMSSIIFVMAIMEISRELRGRKTVQTGMEEKAQAATKTSVETRRFGTGVGWLVGFSLATYLFGFLIAIPLFGVSYLKWRGRSWLVAAIFAIATLAIIYGTFEFGFRAQLYRGLIFGAR